MTAAIIAGQALVRHQPYAPNQHPALVYVARLAKGSRRTMRAALDTIAGALTDGSYSARDLPWHQLRYQHTQAVRSVLAERYAPSTANKHLAALRGVLKEAWRLGLIEAGDYQRATDLAAVSGEALPAGRELSLGELTALFDACAQDPAAAGVRDAAILAVLYGGGLRRSELVTLNEADYDRESGAIIVRAGKGRKDRLVYAAGNGRRALDAWIAERGAAHGALFCPVRKGGRVTVRRMSDQAVVNALRKRARQAGVAGFSPHDLRRTFISHLLDRGADIATVQRLAGHANVTTTSRYDRRGERTKQQAAELLHVPYTARVIKP